VIGAGLGGLTCGALLARRGVPVRVLERSGSVGGYASSFRRGPFEFEVSLHAAAAGDTPFRRVLRDLGVLDLVELVRLPEFYRVVTPAYDLTFPAADPLGFARVLSREFPAERAGIEAFVGHMTRVAAEVNAFHLGGERVTPLFPLQYPAMWRTRGKTLADLLDRTIRHRECRALMSTLWCYYGLPPSLLSGFYFSVATGQYLLDGGFYPKRRSQDLSDALVSVIEAGGGEVIRSSGARRIATSGRRAVAVEDEKGRTHRADVVISNADPGETFGRLLDARGLSAPVRFRVRRFRRRLDGSGASLSSFVVWLGLDRDVTEQLGEAEVFLTTGHDVEQDYRASLAGDPERALIVVTAYDNVYEGYSPTGTSTLTLMFLCSYARWKRHAEAYRRGDKVAYEADKDRVARALIERVESVLLPGLSGAITTKVVATPLTNVRYTGNREGAIYGYEQTLDNAFYKRLGSRTPVERLYLASAWCSPGGSFPGAIRAGELAYKRICRDLHL
jgi:prolycopene isomerase